MSVATVAARPARRTERTQPTNRANGAILASAAAIAVLLIGNRDLPVGLALLAVAIPLAAWISVFRAERSGRVHVDIRTLAVAIGALLVLAVALAPTGSHDVWSYSMYGRMISAHGVSPYTHVPRDFPHDSFLHLVARGWRATPSVYGPVFIAFAAVGSALAGGSVLLARLFHEAGAALAVAVALTLLWRRTHSPAAVMLLGLNPLVIVSVVNGGHNDALVGLGVLVAVLLVEADRPTHAGVALGLAVLIKVTALLALPALVAWAFVRFGRGTASRLAGVALTCVLFGYALAGPTALAALGTNHRLMSRASPWQLGRALLAIDPEHLPFGLHHTTWLAGLGLASLVVVGGLALAIAWRRRGGELAAAVTLAMSPYLALGLYVLPWYVMWVLPVACIVRQRSIVLWTASFATFLTAVYVIKDRALPGSVGIGWWWAGAYVGPVVLLVAFLVIARRSRAARRPAIGLGAASPIPAGAPAP